MAARSESPFRTTALELEHALIVKFRNEAARREMTVPQLIRDLLDVIAADELTTAILDDGGHDRRHNPPSSVSRGGR